MTASRGAPHRLASGTLPGPAKRRARASDQVTIAVTAASATISAGSPVAAVIVSAIIIVIGHRNGGAREKTGLLKGRRCNNHTQAETEDQ